MFVPENPLPIVNKLSATWINTNKAVAELVQCNFIVTSENGQESPRNSTGLQGFYIGQYRVFHIAKIEITFMSVPAERSVLLLLKQQQQHQKMETN